MGDLPSPRKQRHENQPRDKPPPVRLRQVDRPHRLAARLLGARPELVLAVQRVDVELEPVAAVGLDEQRGRLEPVAIGRYLPESDRTRLRTCGDCAIEFVPYDWRLNDRSAAVKSAD